MEIIHYDLTNILKKCILFFFLTPCIIFGQENQSFDGYGNNIDNPLFGTVGDIHKRFTKAYYKDGIGIPYSNLSEDKPNPRVISNYLFSQEDIHNDPLDLSSYVWVFGQFITHDISFVENGRELMTDIIVPEGDEYFVPGTVIRMARNAYIENSGTSVDNPRQYANIITAFLDGSAVYGSDLHRANWLRSFKEGKLKTSTGNLLPWNTKDGSFNSAVDIDAPEMVDDTRQLTKYFVAGDSRANENPLLIAMHTLFVREHNYQCERIMKLHPGWNDERIFHAARKVVIALLQHITYNEWLPELGIILPQYNRYNNTIEPRMINEVSAAALRLGHTLINSNIIRIDNDGNELLSGDITLRDAFFNPNIVVLAGGIEPYLKGMGTQVQQEFDCKVVNDVRNFLFGNPSQGGLDLAAININRGRDRGLLSFNDLRAGLGLARYKEFGDITSTLEEADKLEELYLDINNIDAWVGMLAEKKDDGKAFGKLVTFLLTKQFQLLRDGDRFYYLNDQFSDKELEHIENTSLHDILMRNTDITLMQDKVFKAMPHQDIEEGPALTELSLEAIIYPNPVLNTLLVKVYNDTNESGNITILDNAGSTIISRKIDLQYGMNYIEENVAEFPRGFYNIILQTDRRFRILKMIKE